MKRGILCMLSALLLMGLMFRVGNQVEIRGELLPGVYDPAIVRQSAAAAERAAEEICRVEEALPFRVLPVLCARYTPVDGDALSRTMLEAYDGVAALYAVYAGDERIGTVDDPGLAGTIYDERMATQAMTGARPNTPVTLKRVYTTPDFVTDTMALSRALAAAAFTS